MRLKSLVGKYIAYRISLGEKFRTNSYCLKAFCRYLGADVGIKDVSIENVTAFLYGNGPVTSAWFVKYSALEGFYQYVINRGYVEASPLPIIVPKRPPSFVPYIYTREELRRLFQAAFTYQINSSCVEPYMIYIVLLLLYGTGLRLHEALSLSLGDVDLTQAVITVKATKFYKSRLVPFGTQIATIINEYISWRTKMGFPKDKTVPFFYGKANKSLIMSTVQDAFQRIREKAGVKRTDGARYQPRLHDLRHTFAVHRLISWYQKKADVQQLLPLLSVYLGHATLAATSVYLTMTNELLQEAGKRFEEYARRFHDDK